MRLLKLFFLFPWGVALSQSVTLTFQYYPGYDDTSYISTGWSATGLVITTRHR
jgi:hypothetical protein